VAARRRAHWRLMIHRVVNRENPRPNNTAQNAEANTKNPELSDEKMPMYSPAKPPPANAKKTGNVRHLQAGIGVAGDAGDVG